MNLDTIKYLSTAIPFELYLILTKAVNYTYYHICDKDGQQANRSIPIVFDSNWMENIIRDKKNCFNCKKFRKKRWEH